MPRLAQSLLYSFALQEMQTSILRAAEREIIGFKIPFV